MPSSTLSRSGRALALPALVVALVGSLLVAAPQADAATTTTPTTTETTEGTPTTGSRLLEEAEKHRGKPYQYGATGPSRFDCSGFTKYVYSRVGKSLPRTSREQYRVSRKIAKADKEVGDLIFTRSRRGRIGHVGIYAGSGKFWVSPKSGDVVKLQKIYTSNYSVGRV